MKIFSRVALKKFDSEDWQNWMHYKEPWDTFLRFSGYGVMDLNYESSNLRFLGYANIVLLIYYVISGLVFSLADEWSLQVFCETTMIIVVGVVISVQMLTLIVHRDILRTLVGDIENDWDLARDPEEKEILVKRAREGYWVMTCLYFTIFSSAFFFWVNAAIHSKDGTLPANFTILGFRSLEFPYYEINFIFHAYAMHQAYNCMVPFLGYFVSFILQIVGQLEIIAYRIKKIGKEVITDAEIMEILKYSYYKHLNVIGRGKLLSKMFNIFLLIQVFASGSCISLGLFTMINNDILFEFNTVTIFVVASSSHLFCICWYGEVLTDRSLAFATELYLSTWYLASSSRQKELQLIMMRAQNPLYISIGGIAQLRLETFTSVMKSAYSYCAVLSTVNE